MAELPSIQPLGDAALLLQFGTSLSERINREIHAVFRALRHQQVAWIVDMVPAYTSLTIHYDVLKWLAQGSEDPYGDASKFIGKFLEKFDFSESTETGKQIRIPVCYSPRFGPDLEVISLASRITVNEIIRLHTERTYRVYMLGFLPGFAYMGEVDERIAIGRRDHPRQRIDQGSVGIAGRQTGIYPLASPGGWQIIGRTPQLLFEKQNEEPVLLKPGDLIQFYSITEHEFDRYQGRNA